MDPLHAFAARQVSGAPMSEAKDVDAFYDANAFEGLLALRNVIRHMAALLRSVRSRLGSTAPAAPEIARAPGRV